MTPGYQVTVPGALVLAHTALGHAERRDPESPLFQLSHPSEPRRSLRGRGRQATRAEKLLALGTGFDVKNTQKPDWGETDTGTS